MEAILPYNHAVRDSLSFLQTLLGSLPLGEISVRLWDGTVWKNSSRPRCTLVLKHPGALRRMFWPPGRIGISEAYLNGDFDVEGSLEEGVTLGDCLLEMRWGITEKLQLARFLMSLPAAPSKAARPPDRLAGRLLRCGDDFPVDFFRLWLGEDLFASCSYFASADEPLEKAQERELDYLCRKLGLKPGDRLLDLGCGWGSLIKHAAWRWDADAHGVTASQKQAAAATARLRTGELKSRCRIDAIDPRDLEFPHCYDKLVSIGILNPVRESELPGVFAQAWRLLRPGGIFLYQGVSGSLSQSLPKGSFLDRYLFPDGTVPPVTDLLRIGEMTGFEIRDLENLREHATLTVRNWITRLETEKSAAIAMIGETNFRTWHLGLAAAAHGFRTGRLNLYQTVLVKPEFGESQMPLMRWNY